MKIREKESKTILLDTLELKDLDRPKGIVSFYFAAWTRDLHRDTILQNAYTTTIAGANARYKREGKTGIYHNRDHSGACGKPIELGVDEKGAWVRSQLALKTIVGGDTFEQYEAGLIMGHSQEFWTLNEDPDGDFGRYLKELKLWGVTSVTDIPANLDTPTISMKSFTQIETHLTKINDVLHNGKISDKLGETFCAQYKRLEEFMQKNAEFQRLGVVHCEHCKSIIADESPEAKCASCGRYVNKKKSLILDNSAINNFRLGPDPGIQNFKL